MFTSKHLILLASMAILISGLAYAEPCVIEIQDEAKKIHLVVEECGDIGTFSIGGLYGDEEKSWEKLTFHYPKPWKGTFMSLKVDGRVYSNTLDSQEKSYMDPYVIDGPEVRGDLIYTSWLLPGNLWVEQSLRLVENGVELNVSVTNKGDISVSPEVRFHIDTMLGENDGAPIYIPGDGLKSYEAEYSGENLDFRYWKAYNKVDDPWMVSTGILADQRYPDKVIVSNWKKSIYSSWEYAADPETSILGDSAVILYYGFGRIDPGQSAHALTKYLNGEPILPASEGLFGIAEIVPGNLQAAYCPGQEAILKVDVLSRKQDNEGQLTLEVKDEKGSVIFSEKKYTGVVETDSVRDIPFRWRVPENIPPTYFNVSAILYDNSGEEISRKQIQVLVDYTICASGRGGDSSWLLLLIPLMLIVFAVAVFVFMYKYSEFGEVEVEKEKEGERVKVTVANNKKREVNGCVVIDRITEGSEVDVFTSGVNRKGSELVMYVGDLGSGEKAVLEYRIKDVEFLPPAIVRWDGGEAVSR